MVSPARWARCRCCPDTALAAHVLAALAPRAWIGDDGVLRGEKCSAAVAQKIEVGAKGFGSTTCEPVDADIAATRAATGGAALGTDVARVDALAALRAGRQADVDSQSTHVVERNVESA